MALKIGIIIGSTREGRFADKPATWLCNRMKDYSDVSVELIDLREYPLPYFNEAIPPSMIQEPYADPQVQKWTQKVAETDAYIIVSPEYNHGYSAVLKNALDYVSKEWANKPVSFVSYGSAGGARAVEQLRQVVIELQMAPMKYAIHMMWDVIAAIMQDPSKNPAVFEQFNSRADGMVDQLVTWGNALKQIRK